MYHNQCKLVETRAICQLKRSYPQWDRLELPTAQLFPTLNTAHLRKPTSPDPSRLPKFQPTPPLPDGSIFFSHVSEEPPAQPAYNFPPRIFPLNPNNLWEYPMSCRCINLSQRNSRCPKSLSSVKLSGTLRRQSKLRPNPLAEPSPCYGNWR